MFLTCLFVGSDHHCTTSALALYMGVQHLYRYTPRSLRSLTPSLQRPNGDSANPSNLYHRRLRVYWLILYTTSSSAPITIREMEILSKPFQEYLPSQAQPQPMNTAVLRDGSGSAIEGYLRVIIDFSHYQYTRLLELSNHGFLGSPPPLDIAYGVMASFPQIHLKCHYPTQAALHASSDISK